MLESVVAAEGTGTKAAIYGYRVAGKTGTAEKAESGGYSKDLYMSVFAGVAPATDPHLAAVVVIDTPTAGLHRGGDVAAPVFSAVMGPALRLLGVAPDATVGVPADEAPGPVRVRPHPGVHTVARR
jgi:cell division protein FtsI (penicillin-binding protein 3)